MKWRHLFGRLTSISPVLTLKQTAAALKSIDVLHESSMKTIEKNFILIKFYFKLFFIHRFFTVSTQDHMIDVSSDQNVTYFRDFFFFFAFFSFLLFLRFELLFDSTDNERDFFLPLCLPCFFEGF